MSHLTKAQLLSMPIDKVFQEYLTEYVQSKAPTTPEPAVKPRSPVKFLYGKKNGSGSSSRKMRPNDTRVRDLTKKERTAERELLSPRRSPRKQADAQRASTSTDPGPLGVESSSSTQLVRKSPCLMNRSRRVWTTSAKPAGLKDHSPAKLVAGMRTSARGLPSASPKGPGKGVASSASQKTTSSSAVKVSNSEDAIELTEDSEDSDIVCLTRSPLKKKRRILPRDPARVARRHARLEFLLSGEEDWDAIIIKPKKKTTAPRSVSPKIVEGSVDGEEEEIGAKYAYVRVATGEMYYGQIVNATPSP